MMNGLRRAVCRAKSSRSSPWRRPSRVRSSIRRPARRPAASCSPARSTASSASATTHSSSNTRPRRTIDGDYLERLWTDFQITIYAHYVEQAMGIPITGIIYNVLGEGTSSSRARAKPKRSISGAPRGTDGKVEDGQDAPRSGKCRKPTRNSRQRLAEKYADPAMFHREKLYLSRDRFDILRSRTLGTDPGVPRRPPPRGLLPEHRVLLQLPPALRLFRALPLQRQSQRDRELLQPYGAATKNCGCCRPREPLSERRTTMPCYQQRKPPPKNQPGRPDRPGLRADEDRQDHALLASRGRAVPGHRARPERPRRLPGADPSTGTTCSTPAPKSARAITPSRR